MGAAEKARPVGTGRTIRSSLVHPTWGITAEAARKYRERGVWLEGKHWWYDPVGRVVYCVSAIDEWLESTR